MIKDKQRIVAGALPSDKACWTHKKGALRLPFVCNKKRPRGLLDCWIRNVSGLLEVLPDLRSVCLLAVLEDTLPLELVAKAASVCEYAPARDLTLEEGTWTAQ